MRKKLLSLLMFGIFVMGIGLVSAGPTESMIVNANIMASEVSIAVPDEVSFPDMARGYVSERVDISLVNDGTESVTVTAELNNYTGDIFTNIGFRDVLDDPLTNIQYFEIDILRPNNVGEERTNTLYMYLDLEEYPNEITSDMMNHEAEIVFTAVPL